jgi:hypothetical protein
MPVQWQSSCPSSSASLASEAVSTITLTSLGLGLRSLHDALDGERDGTDLEFMTDKVTDELFGIDRLGDTTMSVFGIDRLSDTTMSVGPSDHASGAVISPSVDTTPGPFDTVNFSFACTEEEKPAAARKWKVCMGQTMNKFSSTTQEVDELHSWAREFDEAATKEDADSRISQNLDNCGPPSWDEKDVSYVFRKFIASETPELEEGVTIMLMDVPKSFRCRPELFEMIESLGSIDSVDYIYLPMAVDRPNKNRYRNKGFCFIHFSDANMAQNFMNGIFGYDALEHRSASESLANYPCGDPHDKNMTAAFAKFQGVSTNLHNLIDIQSKKWRPKNGFVCVRTDSGLSDISLLGLRVLAMKHAKGLTVGQSPENVSKLNDDDADDDDNYGFSHVRLF